MGLRALGAEVKFAFLRAEEMRGEHCRGVLGSKCQEVGEVR